jgi:hypothetical protein
VELPRCSSRKSKRCRGTLLSIPGILTPLTAEQEVVKEEEIRKATGASSLWSQRSSICKLDKI